MKKRAAWAAAILLILVAIGARSYTTHYSPKARAAQAADRFWGAVVHGDAAAMQAAMGSEANFQPEPLVEAYRLHKHFPGGSSVQKAPPNRTGVEFVVLGSLARPDGFTVGVMAGLKRVDGAWRVVRAGSHISY